MTTRQRFLSGSFCLFNMYNQLYYIAPLLFALCCCFRYIAKPNRTLFTGSVGSDLAGSVKLNEMQRLTLLPQQSKNYTLTPKSNRGKDASSHSRIRSPYKYRELSCIRETPRQSRRMLYARHGYTAPFNCRRSKSREQSFSNNVFSV